MKRNPLTLSVGIILVLIFIPWLTVFQVRKSEVAVITTFGKISSTVTTPGSGFKWPPPIQQVYKFDQRIQNFEQDKFDENLTQDGFNLLTMVYVGWRISKPDDFLPKFPGGSIARAEETLAGLVRSAKAAVVGKHPLSDFVSTDEKQLKFADIENEILKIVQDQVNAKNYGIEMEFLGIKKMGFPESVTQEVFKQMTSEGNILISKTQSDGEAEATRIRSLADSKSLEMLANANAEATKIKGQGVAEAAQSFTVFQREPDLARFLLDLDTIELSLKSRTTLIFDQRTQPFQLFQGYLTNSPGQR